MADYTGMTWHEALACIRASITAALPEAYRVMYVETACELLYSTGVAVNCTFLREWVECRDYRRYDCPEIIAAEYIELTS